jgi:hypothetical protein
MLPNDNEYGGHECYYRSSQLPYESSVELDSDAQLIQTVVLAASRPRYSN